MSRLSMLNQAQWSIRHRPCINSAECAAPAARRPATPAVKANLMEPHRQCSGPSMEDKQPANQSHGSNDAENEGNSIAGHKNLLPISLP